MKRWLLLALIAVGLIGAAGYLGFASTQTPVRPAIETPPTVPVERGDVEQTVTAPGTLIGTREVALSMSVGGRLAELNARPGDAVKAGQVLASLDTSDLEQAVAQAELTFLKQQAIVGRTLQPDPDVVASARAALASAQAAYDAAKMKFETNDDQILVACFDLRNAEEAMLAARDAYAAVRGDFQNRNYDTVQMRAAVYEQTRNAYEAALAQCNLAKSVASDDSTVRSALAQLNEAKLKLDDLLSPSNDSVLAAQADLELARLALEEARRRLASATIVAPFDGIVLEVKAGAGEIIGANAPLIVLTDPKSVEVQTSVIEEDLPLVRSGQPVKLFFDAQPDAAANGAVSRIVPERGSGDRPLYPVYVEVGDLPAGLATGMTVDASIVIGYRSDVLRLPRAVVRVRSDGTAIVKVWLGDRVEERVVTIGLRGDQYVEILEGLREGDRVVGQ